MPRLKAPPALPPNPVLVSIIIPARNEERAIAGTVLSFLDQSYPRVEVIVVNDRSEDATGKIVGRMASQDPRVILVNGVEPEPDWLGKPWALQQGADRARGDLLLFVDADVRYAPHAVAASVDYMDKSGVDLASFFPNFEMVGFWERVAMPCLAFAAFVLVPAWLSNRTRIAGIGIGGGCGNLVTRKAYENLGQHHVLKTAVVDDVALARLVRKRGGRTTLVRAEDLISLRMYHGGREVIEGFTKNLFSTFGRSYIAVTIVTLITAVGNFLPWVLAAMALVGGKVTLAEWLGIITLAIMLVIRIVLYWTMHYGFWNALLAHPLFMAFWLYVTLRSVWYTGVRRQLHWRGRTYDAARTRFGAE